MNWTYAGSPLDVTFAVRLSVVATIVAVHCSHQPIDGGIDTVIAGLPP